MIEQPYSAGRNGVPTAIILCLLVLICLSQPNLWAASRTVSLSSANADGDTIQNAFNGLPVGGEVVLGPGTYVVRQPIILQSDYRALRGSGARTILFLRENANCPVIIVGAPDKRPRPASHLRLTDLFIDGNREHQQVELWRIAADGSWINNNGV